MKINTLARKSLAGFACMSFMVVAASASDRGTKVHQAKAQSSVPKEHVIFVDVTGSRIPQRVVVGGQQVNSSSPLYVVRNGELGRTGSTSVYGMLALDPSISTTRRSH